MIFEWKIKDADRIAIRGCANSDRLHSPGKAIDQTSLDELQRLRFLTGPVAEAFIQRLIIFYP